MARLILTDDQKKELGKWFVSLKNLGGGGSGLFPDNMGEVLGEQLAGASSVLSVDDEERDALDASAGDLIWNTDEEALQVFNGDDWEAIGGGGSTGNFIFTGSNMDTPDTVMSIGDSADGIEFLSDITVSGDHDFRIMSDGDLVLSIEDESTEVQFAGNINVNGDALVEGGLTVDGTVILSTGNVQTPDGTTDINLQSGANSSVTVSNGSGTFITYSTTNLQVVSGGVNFTVGGAQLGSLAGTSSLEIVAENADPGIGLLLKAGNAVSGNTVGGGIVATAGAGHGTLAGGALTVTAGLGGATGAGGALTIAAGQGGATSGAGGALSITAGAAAAGNSVGGALSITSGAGRGTQTGGTLSIAGAQGGTTGAGGAVDIRGGDGNGGAGGGVVTIRGGVADDTSISGVVINDVAFFGEGSLYPSGPFFNNVGRLGFNKGNGFSRAYTLWNSVSDDIATIASAATIAPATRMVKVSGVGAVVTITAPFADFRGELYIVPTGVFTWTNAGNIAIAGTAVVSKVLIMFYDGTSWYPSYLL